MSAALFTVGHSTHQLATFIEHLKQHKISAIADVRSQPYSRINPQFNRELLQSSLREVEISYVFLGRELGARSEDESCYVAGQVQYNRLAQTALFQRGLQRLKKGVSTHRITLMCAEKDPLTCHRSILICRHLVEQGLTVQHILEDGRLESHDAAIARLLTELGIEQDLFRNNQDVIADAYAQRGAQIAYVDKFSASPRASR